MSKIAEALAKAKERVGPASAPFGVAAREDALRKARRARILWAVLLPVAVVVTACLLWQQLGDPPVQAMATPAEPVAAAPSSATPAKPSAPAKPSPRIEPAEPVAPPPATSAAPRADLHRQAMEMAISAVLPGDEPRLMLQGRVVHVGDTAEAELVFAGLRDGQIVFRDRRGATYLRRY